MIPRHLLLGSLAVLVLSGAPSAPLAATHVGVAAAVRGSVKVARAAAIGSEIQSGAKLFLGDEISTGPAGGLQILLLDETVFTLGPDSRMTIDTFVYDPASADGKVDAQLVKGAFRFISGRVARKNPKQMNVALPSGTIGIRGTIVFTRVDPVTGQSIVVLSGPGEGNTTGETAGAVEVSNEGVTQELLKSGWGVEVPGFGQPPSAPFPAPAGFFESFQFDATPPADIAPGDADDGASGDPEPGSESEPGSSPLAESGATLDTATSFASQSDQVLTTSLATVERPLTDPVPPMTDPPPPPPPPPAFAPTLISELTDLAGTFSGHYFYNATDVALVEGGDFDLAIDLDFSQQVVGVQLLNVNAPSLGLMGAGSGATSVPFNNQGVEANYAIGFGYTDSMSSACMSGSCNADVQLLFENKDAQIAGVVSATMVLTSSPFEMSVMGSVDDVPITSTTP